MSKAQLIKAILEFSDEWSESTLKALKKEQLQQIYDKNKVDEKSERPLTLRDKVSLILIDMITLDIYSKSPFATHTFNHYRNNLKDFYTDQTNSWQYRLSIKLQDPPDLETFSIANGRAVIAWALISMQKFDVSITHVVDTLNFYFDLYLEEFPTPEISNCLSLIKETITSA